MGAAACPERPPWGCSHFLRLFFIGYIGCCPFLCKEVLLLGAAASPGRPPWGCSYFLRLFFFGISDVARFSARGCCCWGPPRALGGLHAGVLTFCAFFSLGILDVDSRGKSGRGAGRLSRARGGSQRHNVYIVNPRTLIALLLPFPGIGCT